MVIVSITPEIALEKSVNYAGGLGVLEGDKFYAAGDMGLNYLVFSLFYRHGYVKIKVSREGEVELVPEDVSKSFYEDLTPDPELTVTLNNATVYLIPWIYKYKSAKAVLFEAVCPEWARKLTDRLYLEDSEEEKFLKYALLAKATAAYLRERVGIENITVIDLEESYTALVLYELRDLAKKMRIVIHTPGPWGHPVFSGRFLKREFNVDVAQHVNMTEEALKFLDIAIVVSKKQKDILAKVFPGYANKLKPITNGIYIERWLNPELYKAYSSGTIDKSTLLRVRREAKKELLSLLRLYKPEISVDDKPVVTWARRLARYKRPYFIARFIEENSDVDAMYVLSGKPHPRDPDGRKYLEVFKELSLKFKNVVYIPDYSIDVAKILVRASDIWLFTPFSGWEACGTSYMKALINGIPVVSSRDGGAIEIIRDGYNGWLFGDDLRDFINIYEDPRAALIDARDYEEFKFKLLRAIDIYINKKDEYWEAALNAHKTSLELVDIKGVLKRYYLEPEGGLDAKNH